MDTTPHRILQLDFKLKSEKWNFSLCQVKIEVEKNFKLKYQVAKINWSKIFYFHFFENFLEHWELENLRIGWVYVTHSLWDPVDTRCSLPRSSRRRSWSVCAPVHTSPPSPSARSCCRCYDSALHGSNDETSNRAGIPTPSTFYQPRKIFAHSISSSKKSINLLRFLQIKKW